MKDVNPDLRGAYRTRHDVIRANLATMKGSKKERPKLTTAFAKLKQKTAGLKSAVKALSKKLKI